MVKYVKQEMPDLSGNGKRKCYFRIKSAGRINTSDLLSHICKHANGITEGSLLHCLSVLSDTLSEFMAQGYSVTIDGIGTFRPKLGINSDASHKVSLDIENTNVKTSSIAVSNILFKADKELVKKTGSMCTLTKGGVNRVNASPLSYCERLEKLYDYLDGSQHPYIRVGEYARLTSMPASSAAVELRNFSQQQGSWLDSDGRGVSKIYILRNKR